MARIIYGSIVLLLVTLFDVYAFSLDTAAAVFSESIKTSLHVGDLGVSLAVGAFIVGYALMQIPAGFMLDKYNMRYVVSGGILLLVLGNVAIAFTDDVILFSIFNLIQGIGSAFAFTAVAITTAEWFAKELFPIILGLTQTLSFILTAATHYVFTIALTHYTWNQIYLVLAICGFGLFLLSLLLVKSPNDSKKSENLSLSVSLKQVLKNPQILLCTLAAAFSFGTMLAYASFWYLDVQKFYVVGPLDAVMVSGMLFIGIGIGMPFLGWVSNRLKSRKLVIHISLCLGTMFLLMCLYLPHYQINTLAIIKTISFLTGFFISGSMLFYTITSEISSDSTRGVALSATNMGVFLFSSIMMFTPYVFVTSISKMFFTYLWVLPFFVILSILINYFVNDSLLS